MRMLEFRNFSFYGYSGLAEATIFVAYYDLIELYFDKLSGVKPKTDEQEIISFFKSDYFAILNYGHYINVEMLIKVCKYRAEYLHWRKTKNCAKCKKYCIHNCDSWDKVKGHNKKNWKCRKDRKKHE